MHRKSSSHSIFVPSSNTFESEELFQSQNKENEKLIKTSEENPKKSIDVISGENDVFSHCRRYEKTQKTRKNLNRNLLLIFFSNLRSKLRFAGNMPSVFEGSSPVLSVLTHLVGAIVVLMVFVWSISYRGGMAWTTEEKGKIFNLHPVLMLGGFIFLHGEAILVYRLFPGSRETRKAVHASLNGIAFLLAIFGVMAAFRFHNQSGITNMYSLHSWFGMATLILFGIQWVAGFVTFLYPGASVPTRQVSLPWHTFGGVFIYILALTTATQGILEKLTFLMNGGGVEKTSTEAYFANSLGLLVYVLGGLVIFTAVTTDRIKEDEAFRALE